MEKLGGLLRRPVAPLLVLAAAAAGIFAFTQISHAATRTWDGEGTDALCGGAGTANNWNCATNWSSNTLPGINDVATFNSTSVKSANITTNISVAGIAMNSGFTGNVTQSSSATVTVGSSDFIISAGTYNAAGSLILNDAFTLSGGTYNGGSSTKSVAAGFTVTSGTYNPGTSTVSSVSASSSTWNVATSLTLHHYIINKSSSAAVNIASGDTLVIAGTLTLADGKVNTGAVSAKSHVTQAAAFDGGTATVDLSDDTVNQTYTVNGGTGPTLVLNSSADANDVYDFQADGGATQMTVESGFSGSIPISNTGNHIVKMTSWVQNGGTVDASADSVWEVQSLTIGSGATFIAPQTMVASGIAGTWDFASGSLSLNNFTVSRTSALNLGANDTLVVAGTLTLADGTVNPASASVQAYGNIVQASGYDGGAATIHFADNSTNQTYSVAAGSKAPVIAFDNPNDANDQITINGNSTITEVKASSAYTSNIPLINASNYTMTIEKWTQDGSSSYSAAAQSQWVIYDMYLGASASFTAPAEIIFGGISGGLDVDGGLAVNDMVINRTSALTLGANDIITVLGDLELINGTIQPASATLSVRGDVHQYNTFDGGAATISLSDDAAAQTYTIDGGITPVIKLDAAADANDLIDVNGVTEFDGFNVTSGFSGTVPLDNSSNYTLSFDNFTMGAGTLNASAQSAWNIVAMTLSGGSFTPPALVTASGIAGSWDVNGSLTFADVDVNRTSALTLGANDVITVDDLHLINGTLNTASASVQVMGNVDQEPTFDGGSASISFADNAASQDFIIDGGVVPVITLDSAADASDIIDVNAAVEFDGLYTTSGFAGTVPLDNSNDYTLTFDAIGLEEGTLNGSANSAWNVVSLDITDGYFSAPALITASGISGTYDVDAAVRVRNFTVNRTSSLTLGTNDILHIEGNLVLTNGSVQLSNGTLSVEGNVTVGTGFDGGAATLGFTGSNNQTFDLTSATGLFNGDIKINKTGGKVTLASALVMDASGQDLIVEEGTLDLNGKNLTVNGSSAVITVESGGVVELFGTETITKNVNQPTTQAGSIIRFKGDGDSAADTIAVQNFAGSFGGDLHILSTDGATDVFVPSGILNVDGDLHVQSGTLDVTTSNYPLTLGGDFIVDGVFMPRLGSVTLDGGNQILDGDIDFFSLEKIVTSAATLTLTSGHVYSVSGGAELKGASGQLLSVLSSNPGTAVSVEFYGAEDFEYLDVSDNNNIDTSTASCTTGCVDSGNNTNWTF